MDSPTPEYSVDIDEAVQRFSNAGMPRSAETLSRYCRKGSLRGIKIDTDLNEKWLIAPESIEIKIGELKSRVITRHSTISPVQTKNNPIQSDIESNNELQRIKAENEILKVEIRVNKEMAERTLQKIYEVGKTVGELETKLKHYEQIEAPKI